MRGGCLYRVCASCAFQSIYNRDTGNYFTQIFNKFLLQCSSYNVHQRSKKMIQRLVSCLLIIESFGRERHSISIVCIMDKEIILLLDNNRGVTQGRGGSVEHSSQKANLKTKIEKNQGKNVKIKKMHQINIMQFINFKI